MERDKQGDGRTWLDEIRKMKSIFYDFIKVDEKANGKRIDFSSSSGDCLDGDEKIEFLREYSKFSERKNGTINGSKKAVSDDNVDRLLKSVDYRIENKIRKRAYIDEGNVTTYEKPSEYDGWQFYGNVTLNDKTLCFSDGIIPPVPCAKYEFKGEKVSSFAFSFVIPEDYIDEEKKRNKTVPLTTDTGRIIELRRGVKEILKLQIYRSGEIYARVGLPDPYHHRNFKLGDYKVNERNIVIIDLYDDFYEVNINGTAVGKYELTNKATPDTLFVSGGMVAVCEWRFRLESITIDGRTITDFFRAADEAKPKKENIGKVGLPFKIGGAKNKDKVIELTKNFSYDGGKAILNIGSLDPCGEVYINGEKVAEIEDFRAFKKEVSKYCVKGENELKIVVFPRSPEVNYSWHRNKDPYIAWLARNIYIDFLFGAYIDDLVVKTVSVSESGVKAKISFKTVNFKNGLKTKIYLAKSPCGEEKIIFEGDCFENFDEETDFEASLWTCETPDLYTVRVEISENGTPVDDEIIETGFRIIEQKNGEIYLNGKRILLNGALWMQFLPPYENIVLSHICPTTREIVWQAAMTKALNGNVARFHFLGYGNNDPRFAEVCDRVGLMNIWTTRLIDSAETIDLKKGWLAGDIYAEQMREVINHPSIIMWEGSNEFHSSRATMDKMFDEFVTKVKATDDTRIICPCSHLYYGGGLYGNKGFYYQDDGKYDQNSEPCESSFGWKDEKVIRSSHNYEILLGYGGKWDVFRKQAWKSQKSLFKSKEHAYIISEFAVVGRQDNRTDEAKIYHKDDSYELSDEKIAFGEAYDKLDFKLSQAYQALCVCNTVKYMRYLGADGLMWCCLSGGANDASYIKPPIDFYGYAKEAFYALKEGFQKTICFDKKPDLIYGNKVLFEPSVTGAEAGERYTVAVRISDSENVKVFEKKYRVKADGFTFDLESFGLELKDGYYSIEYTLEGENND